MKENKSYKPDYKIEEIINLKKIFWFLKKYIFFIIIITFGSSVLGNFAYRVKAKIYQGQFQIVVTDNQSKASSRDFGALSQLLPNSVKNTPLNTQIKILSSESVLLPLYDYVLNLRRNKFNKDDNFSFNSLKSRILIELNPGTTVLDVSYRSDLKEEIKPVLDKISELYQSFPARDEIRNLEEGISFLNSKLKEFTAKRAETSEKLDKLGKENDINYKFDSNFDSSSTSNLLTLNTELKILEASTKVRELDEQIRLFNKVKSNEDKFLALAKATLPGNDIIDLISDNERIQVKANSIFVENEDYLEELRNERSYLYKQTLDFVFNYLDSQKAFALAQIESNKRPQSVINEYKRLLRKYIRDTETIYKFERQKDELILERSKSKSKWDVITKPIIFPDPIFPNKRLIISFYIFTGFFGSCIFVYFLYLRKNILDSSEDIKETLNLHELIRLNGEQQDKWSEKINLFFTCNKEIKKAKKLKILFVGDVKDDLIVRFKEEVESLEIANLVEFGENIISDIAEDIQILVILTKDLKKRYLLEINDKLNLQTANNLGFIVIYPNREEFFDNK